VIVSSPARMGARPNLAAADLQDHIVCRSAIVWVCEFGCCVSLRWGRDDLRAFAFGLDDGAGLGFGDGLLGLCGGFAGGGWSLSQSVGVAFVDNDLGFAVEAGSVVDLGIDEGEGDLGHTSWLAVAGAGEDDVLHLDAAKGFGGLFAEDPRGWHRRCWTCRSHWGRRWRRCLRRRAGPRWRSQKDLNPSI